MQKILGIDASNQLQQMAKYREDFLGGFWEVNKLQIIHSSIKKQVRNQRITESLSWNLYGGLDRWVSIKKKNFIKYMLEMDLNMNPKNITQSIFQRWLKIAMKRNVQMSLIPPQNGSDKKQILNKDRKISQPQMSEFYIFMS